MFIIYIVTITIIGNKKKQGKELPAKSIIFGITTIIGNKQKKEEREEGELEGQKKRKKRRGWQWQEHGAL